MAHFEKQLSSQEIYQGRVFTVTKDTVQLENGAEGTREVVHHHGGACVAALTEGGRVYLVRQFRYAFGQRELGEEAGLAADHWQDLHPVWPTVGYCSEIIYTYLATGLHPVPMHLDEDEFLTPESLPLAEAVAMCLDGRIVDGKTVAALLKIRALQAEGRL